MTLADAQIDRYARQIILPEVGGRGQARLLDARVVIVGEGLPAETAATLLGRAGIGALALVDGPATLPDLSPDCRVTRHDRHETIERDVTVDLRGTAATSGPVVIGALAESTVDVATLAGRPCAACLVDRPAFAPASGDAPAALALGALVASEVIRVLIEAPRRGRRTTIALDTGTFRTTTLDPTGGCAVCGAGA